jgi:RHS repeat-associated protein
VQLQYDDEGNVIRRTFLKEVGDTVADRVQLLSWDGLNRLVQVLEYRAGGSEGPGNEPNYAYRWTARYDGFGRRMQASTEWGWWVTDAAAGSEFLPGVIGAGTAAERTAAEGANPARQRVRETVVERSLFDPLVEFLEIAVIAQTGSAAAVTSWKVHGPDGNSSYGGLQGLGGLEAVYTQTTATWTGVIDDYYGHIVASVEDNGTTRTFRWQQTKSGGYGPRPDSPVYHLSEGASLTTTLAWRGKRQDITGFYWMGARYYESVSGRFLSPDPFGHAASMSLYDYAGGDPVNFVDPTGRSPVPRMDVRADGRPDTFLGRLGDAWDKLKQAPARTAAGISTGMLRFNSHPALQAWYMQPVKWLGQFTAGFGGAGATANPLMMAGGVGAIADAVDQHGAATVATSIGSALVSSLSEAVDNPVQAAGSLFAGLGGSGAISKLSSLGVKNVDALIPTADSLIAAKSAGQLGREGEAAIQAATGLSKNTQSFVVNGRTRIPDFVNASDVTSRLPSHLIESKNVQYQSLTRQLRDYADSVRPAGGRVDVALPPGARVSRPLQEAFDNPNNPLFRMDLLK